MAARPSMSPTFGGSITAASVNPAAIAESRSVRKNRLKLSVDARIAALSSSFSGFALSHAASVAAPSSSAVPRVRRMSAPLPGHRFDVVRALRGELLRLHQLRLVLLAPRRGHVRAKVRGRHQLAPRLEPRQRAAAERRHVAEK